MVFVKKFALDFVFGVAEGIVADRLIKWWEYYGVSFIEFMHLRKLKAVHEVSHVNCIDCEWVRSWWFWFAAPLGERKAVYSRYFQGTYKEGYRYQLPHVAAFYHSY